MDDAEEQGNPAEEVAKAIAGWASQQPLWKQEAIRRVVRRTHTAEDVQAIATALVMDPADLAFEPLCGDDLAIARDDKAVEALLEIGDVHHVNRLAPAQAIKFGDTGLTVVYGQNGAGKSGYARILKRASGARDAEQIIGNVFDTVPPATPRARLDVRVDGQQMVVDWEDNGPDARLANISVFDSKTAPFFVEKKGGLAYVPFGLDVFERLCALLDEVSSELSKRIQAIQAQCSTSLGEAPLSEEASNFLNGLAARTEGEVDTFLRWTDADEEIFASLSQAVANPSGRFRELQDSADALWGTLDALEEAIAQLDEHAWARAEQLIVRENAARSAARTAASGAFPQDPLPGAGEELWRALYDAAERYSVGAAYPGRDFPPAEPSDRCVLCQQELMPEARDRLQRFRSFVSGEAAATADRLAAQRSEAQERYVQMRSMLSELALPALLTTEHPQTSATFLTHRSAALARVTMLLNLLDGQETDSLAPWPSTGLSEARIVLGRIRDQASELGRLVAEGKADQLAARARDYQCRKNLHVVAEIVRKRHALQRGAAKIKAALDQCGTAAISKFGGDLIKRNVAERLERAFAKEKEELRVDRVPVKLSATARKGAVERMIGLDGALGKESAAVVLSEGEHRAVALAAFLAELRVGGGSGPIILDDPVSSLDHVRRGYVASRLAEEADRRQVIVFTHDLPFLIMLEEACGRAQIALTRVFLERGHGGFGVISSEPGPWDAQKLAERKHKLRELAAQARKHYELNGDDEFYHQRVTTFFDRLRKTWERSLEELVFRDVVRRFRPSVQTKRLDEVVFDDDIFLAYDHGMTNASKLTGHDQAADLGGTLPLPADLEALLDQLEDFGALVKLKSKGVDARRKAKTAPLEPVKIGA